MEFGITPNRGDCLSVLGMAREVSAFNKLALNAPVMLPVASESYPQVISVDLQSEACPRYVGRVIKGINPNSASPEWLVRKLARSGIAV
jgi:phenylalanyl-tRNA synthetase beta chain